MPLTELAIATGAFYAGLKQYRKRRRKQDVNRYLLPANIGRQRLQDVPVASVVEEAKDAVYDFTHDTVMPKVATVYDQIRRRYRVEVSSGMDDSEIEKAERSLNRRLPVLGGSFGLAMMGGIIHTSLTVVSLPSLLYVPKDVYVGSFQAIFKDSKINVDTLSAVLITAYLLKGYILVCHVHAFLYLLNRKLLNKVKREARSQVVDVFRQQPRDVWVLVNGIEVEMPLAAIDAGDIVVAHAGESVPVDGIITEGMASIDQHILTGEAQPIEKSVGDMVFAMTLVLSGRVCIQVEKTGEETTVAHIGHILNRTAGTKTDTELWAETITNRSALPMLALSAVTYPLAGPVEAMILLNAHFRYRLVITASTCVLTYVNLASQQGLLVKDGRMLELLNRIDTVVFDKTGTLTEEQPHVGRIYCLADGSEDDILRLAAAAEDKQTHPIARAILQEAKARQLQVPSIEEAAYKVGYGVAVTVGQDTVCVGSVRFMEAEDIYIPASIDAIQRACYGQGHSLVMVAMDNEVIGAIELHATVRPEARAIVTGLRQRGITSLYIISGDHAAPTQALAESLGIDQYFAETLPENKADLIEQLQREGRTVCYIGDGINDAIAMKRADVSVSLRGASTIATDTAQVILMDESLSALCQLFDLAREYTTSMKTTFSSVLTLSVASLGGMLMPYYGLAYSLTLSWMSMLTGFSSAMWPLIRHRQKGLIKAADVPLDMPLANAGEATGAVIGTDVAEQGIGEIGPQTEDQQAHEAVLRLHV